MKRRPKRVAPRRISCRHMGEVTAEILEALWHPEHPEYYASCQRV